MLRVQGASYYYYYYYYLIYKLYLYIKNTLSTSKESDKRVRKQVYISELDQELWADFRAAVQKKYGKLRRVRGRSYVTVAVEGLLSNFIVQVNDGAARARSLEEIQTNKFEELLTRVKKEGATRDTLCKYIREIFHVRQPRSIHQIGIQFFTEYKFPDSVLRTWEKRGRIEIGKSREQQ